MMFVSIGMKSDVYMSWAEFIIREGNQNRLKLAHDSISSICPLAFSVLPTTAPFEAFLRWVCSLNRVFATSNK